MARRLDHHHEAPGDWSDRAKCRTENLDPDFFFGTEPAEVAAAKAYCVGCPVRPDCLEYALKHLEKGVWGGYSESDRRLLRARHRAHLKQAAAQEAAT